MKRILEVERILQWAVKKKFKTQRRVEFRNAQTRLTALVAKK